MARSSTTFKKGENVSRAGIPNKTTKQAKELILNICMGHVERVNKTLANMEGKELVDALSKLLGLVLPKQADFEGKLPLTLKIEWIDPDGGEDNASDNETA
jgi:hypothetical protein